MAKRAFDKMMAGLEDAVAYTRDGARKGFVVHEPVDIKAIRTKTKLSQVAFASRLHISPATVRDWEQGRRSPEGAARTLLGMVAADPEAAFKLLAKVAV